MMAIDIWRVALSTVSCKIGAEKVDQILSMMMNKAEKYELLSRIYERFCISAQNRAMLPGVIGWIEENPDMRDALANFDFSMTENWEEQEFYTALTQRTARGRRADLSRANNLWRQYSRSLADITLFLKLFQQQDGSASRLRNYIAENSNTKETAWVLAVSISQQIRGMGPTLVCDALKEVGFSNYSKPDTHIKDIFCELGLADSSEDKEVFYALWEFANEVNALPSQVDKIFWLIGTGKFYMFNETYPPMKQEFFSAMRNTRIP